MMPGADFCHIRRAVQGHSRWEPGLAACYSAIAAHVLYNIIRQHCCLAQRLTAYNSPSSMGGYRQQRRLHQRLLDY